MRIRFFLVFLLITTILAGNGCNPSRDTNPGYSEQIRSLAGDDTFSIFGWTVGTLYDDTNQGIWKPLPEQDLNPASVVQYFDLMADAGTLISRIYEIQAGKLDGEVALYQSRLAETEGQLNYLRAVTEKTIARQINQVVGGLGIYNIINNRLLKVRLPPVYFAIEPPPHLLVVSPRDRIQRINELMLAQDISLFRVEELESGVDALGVSSLVVELGGVATYPSFVTDAAGLRDTIDIAVEEWLHQYLAFRPLGFSYIRHLLGFTTDQAIPTINETVVGIAATEIGVKVFEQFYSKYYSVPEPSNGTINEAVFDYNREMREIRRMVDVYLADGMVEEAETYMNERRQYLASHGYHIRKLNQAYFAFFGTYADSPTSIDPIGDKVRFLRQSSLNLKAFLETASGIRNMQDLDDLTDR